MLDQIHQNNFTMTDKQMSYNWTFFILYLEDQMGDRYRDIDRDGKTRKHIDEKYPFLIV